MAITRINGTKGARGTNGAHPTDGGTGTDAIFTQNGKLGADSLTLQANGGDGGLGGNGTGPADGANGGKGGNAAITLNGNIFNAPATATLKVSGTATGGDGGLGGTSVNGMPGTQGSGGNATVSMNGNIVNPNKNMNTIELDAVAVGGSGSRYGNATATLNGNIIQPQKAGQVTLKAIAQAAGSDDVSHDGDLHYGVKTATVNGNIVQGNVNSVWLSADAYPSNGTANLNGNIVQTNPANTGTVTLEASGNTIVVTNNKLHLGKQELDFSVDAYNPYSVTIENNEFYGTGHNSFVFTDTHVPGPYLDTVSANLAAGTFVFDGQSNVLSDFLNLTVSGDVASTLVGSNGANALTSGNGDDTLTGGRGNDTLDGGAGSDAAVYQGQYNQYTLAFSHTGDLAGTVTDSAAGRDGTDTLKNVEFIRFSDGIYDVVNDVFVSNNHAPVAVDDNFTTNEDTVLNVPAAGVLGNDTDVENDPLTSAVVAGPAHGSLTLNSDGSFAYTPDANYNGTDSFTYKANDGTADSNTATVNLTINPVNDAPVAVDDSFTTNEDTPLTIAAPGILGNDTDVENDPLTSAVVTGPAHGSLTLNADGSFTYTPGANFNGTDSFTYKANDGTADSNVATVNLTVNPVNDAPVAVNDAFATNEDTPLTIPMPGVLGNDTDVDGDALTAALVAGPSHGTLTLNPDGSLLYTPDANYNGSDSFTYKANDGAADSNVATATITINPANDAPVAADDSYVTDFETPLTIAAPGVLGNDTDVESDPLTSAIVTGPVHGSLTLNPDGSFTYTPGAGYFGADSFTYKANDGTADSNIATANITVNSGKTFLGTPFNDMLTGTSGDDIFYATTGNDTMDGGGDISIGDTVVFTNATSGVNVVINTAQDFTGSGLGNLSMTNMENLTGSDFDDTLTGDAGRNALNGGNGDDVLVATAGGDTLIGGTNGPAGDTADFSHGTMGVTVDLTQTGPQAVSAEFGAMTLSGIENVIGTSFNDVITGDAGNNLIDGGAGVDTVLFSTQPAATDVGWSGSAFTVTGPDGTDTLQNIEILDDASAGSRILLVGGGGYATINAAIAAAHAGDTILIAPGTYNENVVINKRLNIQGVGPAGSVVIHGTFADHNGIVGPVNEFLRTHAYDVTGVGDGIMVSANNVSLSNLTVEDFNNAVSVSGASVSGLKLNGVTMQHSVMGFAKPDGTALTGLTVDGSTFSDDYIGAYFYNDDFTQAAASDATNTKITNSNFQDLTQKGIYAETLQGNTLFDGLTMNNVGQYGGGTAFGAQGKNGAGIDVNLKFNTYTGNLTVSDFAFTDVGASTGVDPTGDGNAAAIAIKGRDDPSYAAHPADVSGLNVTVKDGTIDGTATGIRAGENKANPADNVTGPAMTISNVDINGNLSNGKHDQIDNRTNSLMTVNGTGGNDVYHAATTAASTGPIHMIGLGGNDSLWGGNGDDTIEGGGGNDILRGAGGNDTIDGGNGTDVAYYSGNEWQYTTVSLTSVVGPDGTDTLTNVERLKFLAPDHVSDLNNDGFGDLLYQRATDGKVQFISSDGTAAASLTAVSGTFGANWKAIQTGVFNSNTSRNASLLLQDTTTGNLEIWKAGANSNSTVLSASPGLGWNAIATGDFDGDGASDVLLQNGPGGQAEIMFLAGNAQTAGVVTGTSNVATPAGWNVVSSGDFNGDGKSDILWQDPASATDDIQISLMDGANTAASATITGPGAGYTAIGTGDFNGDGKSDILFSDASGNALVWTMDGTDHVGSANFAKPAGTGWALRGATDYNRDGTSDLVWQKGASTDVQLVNPNLTAGSLLVLSNTPGGAFSLIASTGGG
jgi:VCBS repeat-containing protein